MVLQALLAPGNQGGYRADVLFHVLAKNGGGVVTGRAVRRCSINVIAAHSSQQDGSGSPATRTASSSLKVSAWSYTRTSSIHAGTVGLANGALAIMNGELLGSRIRSGAPPRLLLATTDADGVPKYVR